MKDVYKKRIQGIFEKAGINVNGGDPWDIQVKDKKFYKKVGILGTLGLGESYVDGWWDCARVDEFIFRVLRTGLEPASIQTKDRFDPLLRSFLMQAQSKLTWQAKVHHYDLGNDFFRAILGRTMIYSCGYWKNASNLEEAQEQKVELVCRKLGLEKGMRVLDIGCGWGETLRLAFEKYDIEATGITLSKSAYSYATKLTKDLPIKILFKDFRELGKKFDHIFSIGMFEHVGMANMKDFMKTAKKTIRKDGLFLLHTIGNNRTYKRMDPWMEKYVFPNSFIPSATQINMVTEGMFLTEDWHSFGHDYDRTLMAWYQNFENSWPDFEKRFDSNFYRIWKYYLLSNAGAFRARHIQLWQIVFSESGLVGGYNSVR